MLSCTTCRSLVMYGHFNVALLLLSMWGFTYCFGRSGGVWGHYAYLAARHRRFSAAPPYLACPPAHIRRRPCHPSTSAPTHRTTPPQTLNHPHTQPPRPRIATDYALRHCDGFACLIADFARIADSDSCYLRKALLRLDSSIFKNFAKLMFHEVPVRNCLFSQLLRCFAVNAGHLHLNGQPAAGLGLLVRITAVMRLLERENRHIVDSLF